MFWPYVVVIVHAVVDLLIPVYVRVLILSGNTQHPGDICTNLTVEGEREKPSHEVLPVNPDAVKTSPRIKLCEFDKNGQAVCDVLSDVGPLTSLKLTFTYNAKAWVIIRQVSYEDLIVL